MRYRSRTEITAMILDAVTAGATKTKIMYKAYLSYTQLKEYLSYLMENGMLRYEEGTQLYRITDKGRKFINVYMEIDEMVSPTKDEKVAVLGSSFSY
jgi:predicted transcriptional regulator